MRLGELADASSICLSDRETRMAEQPNEIKLKLVAEKLLRLSFGERRVFSCFHPYLPCFFSKITLFFLEKCGIIKL